jgi:hypothetical protein
MKLLFKFSFAFLFLSAVINCFNSPIDVYDDFEAPTLKNIWSSSSMESNAFKIQSEIVRKGKSAAKITLKTGDIVEPGNDSSLVSERDELEEADYLHCSEEIKYEYRFSMFLPDSFPIVKNRLIIAQWKQTCPAHYCSDDSPILAIRYQSGKLFITLNNDSGRHRLYELNEEVRNRWLDFRFDIRFSQSNGEIKGFLNDKNIIDYKGITSYSEKRQYHSRNNSYYFKMGLYRDRMPEPMSIYLDEYSKKEIIENKE